MHQGRIVKMFIICTQTSTDNIVRVTLKQPGNFFLDMILFFSVLNYIAYLASIGNHSADCALLRVRCLYVPRFLSAGWWIPFHTSLHTGECYLSMLVRGMVSCMQNVVSIVSFNTLQTYHEIYGYFASKTAPNIWMSSAKNLSDTLGDEFAL